MSSVGEEQHWIIFVAPFPVSFVAFPLASAALAALDRTKLLEMPVPSD